MAKISSKYDWLGHIDGLPKIVAEAVKLGKLDTTEIPGKKSNAELLKLADEAGVKSIYTSDETAWCAVCMVALALRAGKAVNFKGYDRLRAKSFLNFGTKVTTPMLGDILVFNRVGGGHVGIYIGEDDTAYHVAGGNQSNQFCVTRILKIRLTQARRPDYKIGVPAAVKRIYLEADGIISKNEA
ncbi:MAG: TIGR02594 family protein [Bacteroidota bacterium]